MTGVQTCALPIFWFKVKKNMTFRFEFTIGFKVKKNMTFKFEFTIGFKVRFEFTI